MKKVSVNPSMIPGSGMGLFADEYIKRGELIVEVTGEKYSSDSDVVLENNYYLLDSGDGTNDYIDVKGPAMYANDACGPVRIAGMVNNSLFRLLDDGTMWLEATRAIRPGQEVFASYGRAYWAAIRSLQKEAALCAEAAV
jgi:SET domain-containing protein